MMSMFREAIGDYDPNPAHYAIAELGCPAITMNVDGLHQKAGTQNVLAIHGDIPTQKEIDSFWYPYIPFEKPILYGDVTLVIIRLLR